MLLCAYFSLFSAEVAEVGYGYIHWNISPIIVDLEFFTLRWYSLLFTTGVLLSYLLIRQQFRQTNLPDRLFESLILHVLVGMIAGMRLGHFLFYEPTVFLERPLEILLPVSFTPELHFTGYAGLASHGGAIGVLISTYLFSRKNTTVSVWFVLDQLALVTPLLGAFIRLGNLFNSEMIGYTTTVPWAFAFTFVDTLPRHPTQLYEALGYLLVLVGLLAWKARAKHRPSGQMLSLLLISLFLVRFTVEFFKIDQVSFENEMILNMGQLLSLPFIIGGILLYYYRTGSLITKSR